MAIWELKMYLYLFFAFTTTIYRYLREQCASEVTLTNCFTQISTMLSSLFDSAISWGYCSPVVAFHVLIDLSGDEESRIKTIALGISPTFKCPSWQSWRGQNRYHPRQTKPARHALTRVDLSLPRARARERTRACTLARPTYSFNPSRSLSFLRR